MPSQWDSINSANFRYGSNRCHFRLSFQHSKNARAPSLRQLSGLAEPEDAAAFFRDRGARAVVVKMAEQGCYVQTADASFAVPAFRVPAIEHTGAGDAFAAGFLAGLSQDGMDLHHCIRLANAVGAMCVGSVGAADGISTLAETLDFMEQTHV